MPSQADNLATVIHHDIVDKLGERSKARVVHSSRGR
jgi:hypothetical protein